MSIKNSLQKIASSFYNQIDSKVEAFLFLDNKKYELSGFQIVFGQPTDYKGQPQHEVKGGQFILTITQAVEDNIYIWAKNNNHRKTGTIKFTSETEGTVLEIKFIDSCCISLVHKVNAFSGLEISMVISPSILTVNGIIHDNKWKDE
jgi:predicted metallo-beta-lactamase superfamily hydrolase